MQNCTQAARMPKPSAPYTHAEGVANPTRRASDTALDIPRHPYTPAEGVVNAQGQVLLVHGVRGEGWFSIPFLDEARRP